MQFECAHCGKTADKPSGHVNRARKRGLALYCDRVCSGLGRRKAPKTEEQRKAEKRAYDMEYRRQNRAILKASKAAYHQRTYDPEAARIHRQGRMAGHVEYCRRPEYRAWKRDYDRKYRAEKEYGEYADCFLLIQDIRDECLSQQSDYEIRYAKGRVAMTQQRRRDDARTHSQEPQSGSLGHAYANQGRQNGSLTGR